jgi:predicted ester cyclase
MSREQLLEFSDRYKAWFDSRSLDAAALSSLVAPDVKIRIPFNGLPGTFDGLLAHHARVLEATNDFKASIIERYVDEVTSTVTAYLHFTGHHTGYVSLLSPPRPVKRSGIILIFKALGRSPWFWQALRYFRYFNHEGAFNPKSPLLLFDKFRLIEGF